MIDDPATVKETVYPKPFQSSSSTAKGESLPSTTVVPPNRPAAIVNKRVSVDDRPSRALLPERGEPSKQVRWC